MKTCAVRHMILVEKWNCNSLSRPIRDGTTNHDQIFYPYLIPNGIIWMCIKSSLEKGEYKGDFKAVHKSPKNQTGPSE